MLGRALRRGQWMRPRLSNNELRAFAVRGTDYHGLEPADARDKHQPIHRLRQNASACRKLADTAVTVAAREVLDELAKQYEEQAATLESQRRCRPAFSWSLD